MKSRHEGRCRIAEDCNSATLYSGNWSIARVSEVDCPAIDRFRSQGVLIADDYAAAGGSCTDLPNDTSKDVECHSWIARADNSIVGLLKIVISRSQIAHVSALCVDPRYRDSRLPGDLLGYVLNFCWNAGVLKIVLSTHLPQDEAWTVFGECGYDIARHGRHDGRNVMEFYLDLYKLPACERSRPSRTNPS